MTTSLSGLDGASFDLVVIGARARRREGRRPGGLLRQARRRDRAAAVGGAVVNTGTLPSKTLRETALYLSGLRSRSLYGIDYTFGRDDLRRRSLLSPEADRAQPPRPRASRTSTRHGIDLLHGHARARGRAHGARRAAHDGDVARVRRRVHPDRDRIAPRAPAAGPVRRRARVRHRQHPPPDSDPASTRHHRRGRHRQRVRHAVRRARQRTCTLVDARRPPAAVPRQRAVGRARSPDARRGRASSSSTATCSPSSRTTASTP